MWKEVVNYHFLSCALCQHVTIPQVINLNVLDVIAIRDVHLFVERCGVHHCCAACFAHARTRWSVRWRVAGFDGRNLDVLDSLPGIDLSSNTSCSGRYVNT